MGQGAELGRGFPHEAVRRNVYDQELGAVAYSCRDFSLARVKGQVKLLKPKQMAEFVRDSSMESVLGGVDGCEDGEVRYVRRERSFQR